MISRSMARLEAPRGFNNSLSHKKISGPHPAEPAPPLRGIRVEAMLESSVSPHLLHLNSLKV